MTPIMLRIEADADEFKSKVEDMVIRTLHDGSIAPSTLLECVYYAIEPDVLATVRAVAALPPSERQMVMSYAKKLSDGTVG
ncbi:hypothetical protein [Chelativorans sp. YIM 93263]|uniref:hypothetical protein n=1 Tax=Chelativorans sp. YIM 93263 TaxID=2906648 RepID=UPI00237849B7|nr:hypothetical protein [Chelativorans sp. YIM 93263]